MIRCIALAIIVLFGGQAVADDLTSGPEKGAKTPALKVFDATGLHKEKSVDYASDRKDKPTIYLFVQADKFSRPMNRFMKELDGKIKADFEGAYVVAVWLTDDADKTKEFLPRVQQSVQYEATALTCFEGEKAGPTGWGVNGDAHLTVVLADKGKVKATFGLVSTNETDVPKVIEALKKK